MRVVTKIKWRKGWNERPIEKRVEKINILFMMKYVCVCVSVYSVSVYSLRIWCVCACNNKCWHSKMKLCVQMTSIEVRLCDWYEVSHLMEWEKWAHKMHTLMSMCLCRVRREERMAHKNASVWQITAIACYIWMMSACVTDARASFHVNRSPFVWLVVSIDTQA